MSETTHTGQFRPVVDFVVYETTQTPPTGCQQPLELELHDTHRQPPAPPRWLNYDVEPERKNLQIPLKF